MLLACLICATTPAYRCNRCRDAAYCSTRCQETDFPQHKLLCRSFATFAPSHRPSATHRRAIFCPLEEDKPRWVWVQTTPDAAGWDGHDEPHLDAYLQLNPSESGYIGRHPTYIRGNLLRGRPQNDHTIELWQRDHDSDPMLPGCKSLNAVQGHAWSTWRGPLIVTSKSGTDFDSPFYTDANLSDFRDVIDYFYYFRETIGSVTDGAGSHSHFAARILADHVGKAQVIRVACRGDRTTSTTPEFTAIYLPKTHPAFLQADDPPTIANFLGRNISVFPEKPAAAWRDNEDSYDNPAITGLYYDVGDESTQAHAKLGTVRDTWAQRVGSALVLDRSRQDLDLVWVQALCDFCQANVKPWADACRESKGSLADFQAQIRQGLQSVLLN